jgi:AcrR family transcriptional regulator
VRRVTTTRRGPGRPAADSAGDTRAALLAAGRAAFSERGYAGAGIAEIVARAGVSPPVLYHHFAGKADLYVAVAADVYDEVLGALDAAATETGGRFAERLDAVLVAAADLNEADPTIAGFATALPADLRLSAELAPVRDQMARMRDFFLALAADSGIARRRREPVADACSTLIAGLSRAAAVVSSPAEFRRTVESLRLLVKGELFD